MKVDGIEIKNYKGFEDCVVNFHPNMNVFIGSNASGKTTLLTAILKSLGTIPYQILGQYNEIFALKNEDINYKENYASLMTHISNFDDSRVKFKTFINIGAGQNLKIPETIQQQFYTVINSFNNNIGVSPQTIPIIKFYPANRGSITYSEVYNNNVFKISQLETWSNIYQDTLSYSKFFHWFFENETDELRLQRDFKDFNAQSPALRDVRTALQLAFDELGYGDYSILSKQIKRAGNSKLLPSLFLKNKSTGKEENIDSKSEGEKAIITLIADIAYNLSIAKNFLIDNDFLKSPGIVMIDEIETHLHPKWQREILPILSKLFPNIQFFIATHSPQIVASVKSESVFICDNFNVEKVPFKTFGEDSNSILNEIFNTTDRPIPYIKLIQKFDDLIDNDASINELEIILKEISVLYQKDSGTSISNLMDDLSIRLSAYKFEKDYEKDL